ncbi:hypothetical protein NUACC21_36330 [Scytonema sp. NUACC21]
MTTSIINAIKGVFTASTPWIMNKAKGNEVLIKLLQDWKIDLTKHPDEKFDVIYACTLVVYLDEKNKNQEPKDFFQNKDELILEIFGQEKIKTAFDEAFYQNNYDLVIFKIKEIINWEDKDWNTLGESIRKFNIDVPQVLSEFKETFIKMVKLSQTPSDRLIHTDVEEIRENQKLDSIKLDKLLEKIAELEKSLSKPQDVKSADLSPYSEEFEALIQEKISLFCGRKFVFQAFDEFLNKHSKGYFTVVGDAGMGKSAIAAKYVNDHNAIFYFNNFLEGRTRPEQFLESIRHQLINRYNLQNEDADLGKLLTQVSKKLADGERLVIVVDALDEVEQTTGGNLLYLPTTLPDKVYFLLTRRPYIPNQKRLFVQGTPVKELDLTSEYTDLSQQDIKDYIRFSLENDACEYKDDLNRWIQNRKENITTDAFVEQVAEKSENNFMYLRFVLPDIANGNYDDLNLRELPDGLQQYYETHWERLRMTTPAMSQNAIILYVLVEAGKPISCEAIASITNRNEDEVLEVLQEWTQFLRRQRIKEEECYSMYHKSFTDFLRAKPTLKKNRVQLQDIQSLISQQNDRLWEELEKEGEEEENE